MKIRGRNILIHSRKGWALPEIWDTLLFCPDVVLSGGVMAH